MHRYRGSRPWSVVALAGLSSITAVLMTGGVAASVANVGLEQRERLGRSLIGLIGGGTPAPGGWRIQVGTFRSRDAALARLVTTARSVPALAGARAERLSYGPLTRARFTGLPDEASAQAMCAQVVASGSGCFVLPPRSEQGRVDAPQGQQSLADE